MYTMEYYSAIKKKKILPFPTAWMDLENIMLSEIGQSGKVKYHIDFTHMWNLMNKLNRQNRDRLTEQDEAIGGRRLRAGGME